ncbi:cupin domain-containing protein [Peribacillus sp. NPDC058002]|uniref:cupin domain-containing protein n=1 Tax=Peribacillus sp. NPDC058002 TaxID=3346301 RepID=UPI0036D8F15F
MHLIKLEDIEGEIFPAGRHSKILVGKGKLKAEHFVTGHSDIFPEGKIPLHSHSNEEIYIILSGKGVITVGKETKDVEGFSVVYIPPNIEHSLVNIGEENLTILYVYAPAGIVDHWEQERTGQLK